MEDPQAKYLNGLRTGDPDASELILYDDVTQIAQYDIEEDLNHFSTFLAKFGQFSEKYIAVKRDDLVAMLQYADERRCLVLQNCFGFDYYEIIEPKDMPPQVTKYKVGKMLLVQKGNFWQDAEDVANNNDDGFFTGDTKYRDENKDLELYRNMSLNSPLTIDQAKKYVNNFLVFNTDQGKDLLKFIHGYMLPVKALHTVLTDSTHSFGQVDELFILWGLSSYNQSSGIGNFSFFIGTNGILDNPRTGPIIICRDPGFSGSSQSDCPPHPGCAL